MKPVKVHSLTLAAVRVGERRERVRAGGLSAWAEVAGDGQGRAGVGVGVDVKKAPG